ncbi:uncharacterized protein LOC120085624 isoform X3 [Benincasa hispida]|uniref:uncharacterized protein LOC120085624 isoform X3 n=1 Tax=Benincasa hispida TaxID=102211 RepID=UPI001900119D|nr:uncharacterized protein LOC120085624 isoform X3 [Benincasa hispida]
MTGGSFGLRTGSYASLHQQLQNDALQNSATSLLVHKLSKTNLSSSRERERVIPLCCRYFGRRRVAMLLLFILALLVFVFGSFAVSRDSGDLKAPYEETTIRHLINPAVPITENFKDFITSTHGNMIERTEVSSLLPPFPHPNRSLVSYFFPRHSLPSLHPCRNFALPPPAPANGKRTGARPCPVCYIPVEQAIASMPIAPSISPVLRNLTYIHDRNPIKTEPHGGSDFGGYPSLRQRNDSFNIKESMTVHCGFVKGSKPGNQSGFDIDEADLLELEEFHEVIVASAIFGNYDVLQQPINISEESKRFIPFYMFIDEETEAYMKNSSLLDSRKRIGLWRIIVVHNVPYADSRRNGKIPKLLLHRLFPNIQYSIWIDGKLQLVVDPFQILERFLWRQNATFAISRHYKRFDVFEEADANKAAGKYDNSSIDEQIDFYVSEGLTPYSLAKLPITSDVPEGCVLIREHVPITNLFTCLWFNEVDRFTSRDQLSFSMVRDKIMSKVNWSLNMFLDCERRNFVIQTYHRELLEHMPPPARAVIRRPPPVPDGYTVSRPPVHIVQKTPPVKRNPSRRGRNDKREIWFRCRALFDGTS